MRAIGALRMSVASLLKGIEGRLHAGRLDRLQELLANSLVDAAAPNDWHAAEPRSTRPP